MEGNSQSHLPKKPSAVQQQRSKLLNQIKASLLPYQALHKGQVNGETGDYSTLSSESSSGTASSNGQSSGEQIDQSESAMVECLYTMGFQREHAWYALKLTQFRNIQSAVDVLIKLKSSHVFRNDCPSGDRDRRSSFDDSGSSRSNSPMPVTAAIAQPSLAPGPSTDAEQRFARDGTNALLQPGAAGAMPSLPSYQQVMQQQLQQQKACSRDSVATSNSDGSASHFDLYAACYPRVAPSSHHRVALNQHILVSSDSAGCAFSYLPAQPAMGDEESNCFSSDMKRTFVEQRAGTGINQPQVASSRRVERPAPQNAAAPGPVAIASHGKIAPLAGNLAQLPKAQSYGATVLPPQPHSDLLHILDTKRLADSQSTTAFGSSEHSSLASCPPHYSVHHSHAGTGYYVGNSNGYTRCASGGEQQVFGQRLHTPEEATYMERLSRRSAGLLLLNNSNAQPPSSARGRNDVEVGRDECSSADLVAEMLLLQQFTSPQNMDATHDMSTDDNYNGGTRCVSPLPLSVMRRVQKGGADSSESPIKPITPGAFKFFMEQHVENVVKHCRERTQRRMQLEKEMGRAVLATNVQCHMRHMLNEKESRYLRLRRQRLSKEMFERIKVIGQGAFGEVVLVRKVDTDSLYAMKILRKMDVIKKNQAAHVKAERDILSEADNEWVVKLFYSFQDKDSLFFIMEYIPGGDLMTLLIKMQLFSDELARFYIAELVCAIDSVHKLKFIHRDIKPDNILIDRNGHIKLTDFGLCTGLRWTHDSKYYKEPADHARQDSFDLLHSGFAHNQSKLLDYRHKKQRGIAHSLVGTPNYIAPEILLRLGHTQLCDWWSVGVILYEMLLGRAPFHADTPDETQLKIIRWRDYLYIPEERPLNAGLMSRSATSLIAQLCCDQEERLGRTGADAIRAHPFFVGIDWEHLRTTRAPYRPEILHATDTRNFDPISPRADDPAPATSSEEPFSDHAFYEFTFRRFFEPDGYGCPTLRINKDSRTHMHGGDLTALSEECALSEHTSRSSDASGGVLLINTGEDGFEVSGRR